MPPKELREKLQAEEPVRREKAQDIFRKVDEITALVEATNAKG